MVRIYSIYKVLSRSTRLNRGWVWFRFGYKIGIKFFLSITSINFHLDRDVLNDRLD